MKLILHHCLKDLRAFRWPIALWLAALLTDGALQAFKVDRFAADLEQLDIVAGALVTVGLALTAFGWVIAVMIVQADPLDNPSAFWLTRPLSPRALLAGKLLLLLPLFLLLPVAVASVVASVNGAGGWLLATFALERLAVDAALFAPVLVAAAVAHNLARTVLVATAGFLIYGVIHSLAILQWLSGIGSARDYVVARTVGMFAVMALSVVSSLALLAHQYLTRATRRTLWMAAAALTLTVAAGDFWPWSWNPIPVRQPPRLDAGIFDPAAVRLSIDQTGLRRGPATITRPRVVSLASGETHSQESQATVETRGSLWADDVPPAFILRILRGTGEVRFGARVAQGRVYGVYTSETPYSRNAPGAALAGDVKAAFETALQARIVNTVPVVNGISAHLFDLPERTFLSLQGVPGTFRASVEVEASRVVLGAPVPLVGGAATRLGGEEVTIVATADQARDGVVTVRLTRPRVWFGREPETQLVIRNRRTREAFFPTPEFGGSGRVGLLPFDVDMRRATLRAWHTSAVIDARWLADAELIIAALQPIGTFTTPLALADFMLPQSYYR